MPPSHYLGLMSGTSIDGVDAAIVGFPNCSFQVVQTHFTPYPAQLKERLNTIIQPEWRGSLSTLLDIDHQVGKLFAKTAVEILSLTTDLQIKAIGTHGQTVHHQPDTTRQPNSWQLGDPSLIVEATGITTIADWRRRDMAAGGQGAPLTPAFHSRFFHSDHDVVVLNLGGIANISIISKDKAQSVLGFDTGPANTLIDSWASGHLETDFDKNGDWAKGGDIHAALLQSMLSDNYFQLPPPKSTGREHFNSNFIQYHLNRTGEKISSQDIQATLTELTAITVTNAIRNHAKNTKEVLICGGGAYNRYLSSRLQAQDKNIDWKSTAEKGLNPEYVEAAAFAWFAKQTLEGRPLLLENITGARGSRIAGAIYPA